MQSKYPQISICQLGVISSLLLLLMLSGCGPRVLPGMAEINELKPNESVIAFRAIARHITVEYDGETQKVTSVEPYNSFGRTIRPLGSICSGDIHGLRSHVIDSDEDSIFAASFFAAEQQDLRFPSIPMTLEPGKINYIGKAIFDIVTIRRIYPDQSRLSFYVRIKFEGDFDEAKSQLAARYQSAGLEIVDKSINSEPILFNDASRFYSIKKIGWLHKIDKMVDQLPTQFIAGRAGE